MSVFRTSDDELYVNALVLTAKGSRGRPGFILAPWAGRIFEWGVFLNCINLAIVSFGIAAMFLFRFPIRLNIHLFLELFFWSMGSAGLVFLSPMILGTVRIGLDFEAATLEVALSKFYYLNFALSGVSLFTFLSIFAVGERIENPILFSICAVGLLIVFWSGYCYLQVSRMGARSIQWDSDR